MSIEFYKTASAAKTANYLAKKINDQLGENKSVLLFLSGGSAIDVAAVAAKVIKAGDGLTITLIDERYGRVGHADSNAEQLAKVGFSLKFKPILEGEGMLATAQHFNSWLSEQIKQSDYKIALLGIGWGGHTSGILPGSPAIESEDLVCAFTGPDFERITTTAKTLELLDAAVVYSVGKAKRPELERFETDLTVAEQPAQILKKIPDVAIFNDYKGDEI